MAVVCGYEHTLTLDDNGDLWAFGRNNYGQCGIDTNGDDVNVPTKIFGSMDIVHIAAGSYFSACVDVEGHLWTFGKNDKGQLGHGDTKNRSTPTRVEGLDNIRFIYCGSFHTICISSNHKVYAFGDNKNGQIGICKSVDHELLPVLVPLDVDIKQIACGGYHNIFLTYDNDVWVCGFNEQGQLGLGDNENRNTPVNNPFLNDIVSVACGSNHTIVMNSEHQLFSFGYNNNGQLGVGDHKTKNKPEPVQFSEEIHSFSCGTYHTLILDTSNRILVFGINTIEGDRIDGYHDGIMLNEPSDVCLMSNGGYHIILKTVSNEIWAFGYNDYHQLPLPFLNEDENGDRIIKIPERAPPEHNHIIGTTIDRFKSHAKSARK